MKMKTLAIGLLVAGMILELSGLSQAQMVGLPVMDTAAPRNKGDLEVTPGAMFGQDMDFYGARATVSLQDDLRAFLDLGQVDLVDGDANFGVQGGALYSLEPNDFVDLGLRGTAYYVNTDLLGLTGLTGMLVFSDETLLNHLYCYGGAGLAVVYKSSDVGGGSRSTRTEVNPALSLGLSLQFSDNFSLFTEANYIDGVYVGCGLSIR